MDFEREHQLKIKIKNFSWKRVGKILGAFVALCALAAGVYFLVTYRPAKIAWASLVLDQRQHYLSCYELPFYPQVEKAMAKHADVVEKIKQAGALEVKANLNKCSGFKGGIEFLKGDIEIYYNTHEQRLDIEKLIGDNFFGIPYRGYKK